MNDFHMQPAPEDAFGKSPYYRGLTRKMSITPQDAAEQLLAIAPKGTQDICISSRYYHNLAHYYVSVSIKRDNNWEQLTEAESLDQLTENCLKMWGMK